MRTCYYTLAPSEQHILLNAVFCEDRLAKIPVLYARLIRSSHTQNGVERFWNGPVHELYSLKASRMCKVHTSSHEITNKPYVSSNCENTGRTGFTTNYDAETNTSLIENSRMFVNTTSKVAPTTANWMRILTEATCIVRLNI